MLSMVMVMMLMIRNLARQRKLFSILEQVRVPIPRQKFFVNNRVNCIIIGRDCLNTKVIRAETVLRLLKGVQLRITCGEAGVVAEVGQADALHAGLAGQLVLGVVGVQEAVQARVLEQSSA